MPLAKYLAQGYCMCENEADWACCSHKSWWWSCSALLANIHTAAGLHIQRATSVFMFQLESKCTPAYLGGKLKVLRKFNLL